MWTLVNIDLPTVAIEEQFAVPISVIKNDSLKINSSFAVNNNNSIPVEEIETVVVEVPPYTGDEVEVIVDAPNVDTVVSNGNVFTPGSTPSTLTPGQFFHNPVTGILTIKTGDSYKVFIGITISAKAYTEKVETNVLVNYPDFFNNLPVIGKFSWTRSFEQHPSAQLEMMVDSSKIIICRNSFIPGLELKIFDVGYRVSSYNDVELSLNDFPQGLFKVSVTLQGKWEPYLSKPILLKNSKELSVSNGSFEDPECTLDSPGISFTPSSGLNLLTLVELASKVRANYRGPNPIIRIPKDSPRNATTTLSSELDKYKRINECFVFYSDEKVISMQPLGQVATHKIKKSSIKSEVSNTYQYSLYEPAKRGTVNLLPEEIIYSGNLPAFDVKPKPISIEKENEGIPYPVYDNWQVTGKFSEPKLRRTESNPNKDKPRYKRIPPKRQTLKEGDVDVATPVDGARYPFKTLSLNWDSSGPTKTLKASVTEDGSPIEDTTETWGWVYDGENSSDLFGDVTFSPQWRTVRYENTTYEYAANGYLLGITTTGWDLRRYKQETEELETKQFSAPSDSLFLRLYKPFKLPLVTVTRYLLAAYSLYYKDEDASAAYDQYKKCNRDGSSSIEYSPNPNYVIPMFVLQEQKEVNSFASTTNPESTIDSPLPRVCTGEESFYTRYIVIGSEGEFTDTITFNSSQKPKEYYTEYTSNQSACDGNFRNAAKIVSFKDYEGRPPQAQRKNITFERIEPELDDDSNKNPKEIEYFAVSLGFEGGNTKPVNGSLSYAEAKTLEEASRGAKTDLLIRDFQETLDTSLDIFYNPNIKEGDLVDLETQFFTYKRRVKSVTNTIEFQGQNDKGKPIITTSGTSLTLGIYRDLIMSIVKSPKIQPYKPKEDNPPPNNPPGSSSLTLGRLIEEEFESRRRF